MEPAEDLTEKPDKDIPKVSSDEQREQTDNFSNIARRAENGMEHTDHQANMTEEDLTEDPSDENELSEEMNIG